MEEFPIQRMRDWIHQITSQGIRRPGSPADHAIENLLQEELRLIGYSDVRAERVDVVYWDAEITKLEVTATDGRVLFEPEVQAIPYAKFTTRNGTVAPLLFVDPKDLPSIEQWRDAIIVVEISFPPIDPKKMLKIALGTYDPDHNLEEVNHPATWIRVNWHLYREAIKRGAAGFIGILKDQPGGTCHMYGPYGFREADILDKPIPGVWIGRADGEKLKELARAGHQARLTVDGINQPSHTQNVIAELPGTDLDHEAIVLSCHHDSPFISPVEDASGCSVVMALAEHFKKSTGLRRRLIILFSAGHFYGSIGTRSFIHEHPDIVKKTVLEVSIEHIALEAVENREGNLVPTGRPEPTAMFTSFSSTLVRELLEGVKDQGVNRVIVLPAAGPLGNYPPTDGGDWFEAGVPVINCISNPVYLLTNTDDFHWIDYDRLPKMAAAFAQILRRLDDKPRESIADSSDMWATKLLMKTTALILHAWSTRLGTRQFY
jgi:hypothetical protein